MTNDARERTQRLDAAIRAYVEDYLSARHIERPDMAVRLRRRARTRPAPGGAGVGILGGRRGADRAPEPGLADMSNRNWYAFSS